jgi:hypothetical protein
MQKAQHACSAGNIGFSNGMRCNTLASQPHVCEDCTLYYDWAVTGIFAPDWGYTEPLLVKRLAPPWHHGATSTFVRPPREGSSVHALMHGACQTSLSTILTDSHIALHADRLSKDKDVGSSILLCQCTKVPWRTTTHTGIIHHSTTACTTCIIFLSLGHKGTRQPKLVLLSLCHVGISNIACCETHLSCFGVTI